MRLRLLAALVAGCLAAAGQTPLSVEQLVSFIKSSVHLKQPDKQVAAYLKNCKMTESLDDRTIEEMEGFGAGPRTVEALKLLRDASKDLPKAKPVIPPPPPAPIPPPSSEEQARILDEVRANALNYSRTLPDYICTQVVRRSFDPTGMEIWHPEDTLVVRLSYFEQKEDYKLILVNDRVTTQSYQSLGGATSTGEFGTMLRQIFEPASKTEFGWSRWTTLRKRRTYVFAYRVPLAFSQWHIVVDRKQDIVAGYHGEVFVDQENHMVVRITLEAEDIPPSFPVQQAREMLDYDFTTIGDSQFLLPLRAEMRMRSDRFLSKNETEFRMYRKFSAESEIKFDTETPAPLSDDKTKEQPPK